MFDCLRVRKPPVPAPRRNITVKSPPLSQVTVKDGKSTESKAERTAPSLPPRLRHGLVQGQKASQEAISRQPSTVSPGQETILSPTSPPRPLPAKLAVTTALLGTGAMQCLGQQSVTTSMCVLCDSFLIIFFVIPQEPCTMYLLQGNMH